MSLEERANDVTLRNLRSAVDTFLVIAYGPSTIEFGDVSNIALEALPKIQSRMQNYLGDLQGNIMAHREPNYKTVKQLATMKPEQVLVWAMQNPAYNPYSSRPEPLLQMSA